MTTKTKVVLARLKDLLLIVFTSIGSLLSGVLFVGYAARQTHNLLEIALGGKTLILATLSVLIALATGLAYIFGRPPCQGETGRRIKDVSGGA